MPTKQTTSEKPVRPATRLKTASSAVPNRKKPVREPSSSLSANRDDRVSSAISVSGADRERMIREMAYYLAEKDGFPQGREEEYWTRAEGQVESLLKN